jgi:hypothetical protein
MLKRLLCAILPFALFLLMGCAKQSHTSLEGNVLVSIVGKDPFGNSLGPPDSMAADRTTEMCLLQGTRIISTVHPVDGRFTFRSVPVGSYRVFAQLYGTPSETTGTVDVAPGANRLPAVILLADTGLAVSPNPTAGGAQLVFGLSVASSVDLRIYSSTGAAVRTLLVSDLPAGVHDVFWDTKDNAGAPVLADTYVAVLLERDIAAPRPIRIVGPGPPPETIPWGRVHIRVVTP